MKFCAFLLVLAVFEVSAKPQPSASFQGNDFVKINSMSGSYGSTLPAINTHIQTAVVENPTVSFPVCIPPSTTSETCHCLKTFVRPQLRNEFITVPSVDRIVRTVSTPLVETFDCGGGSRLTTFTPVNILPGVTEIKSSNGSQNRNSKRGSNENSMGKAFNSSQMMKSQSKVSSNVANNGVIGRPAIFTFQALTNGDVQRLFSSFSHNSAFSNGGINHLL